MRLWVLAVFCVLHVQAQDDGIPLTEADFDNADNLPEEPPVTDAEDPLTSGQGSLKFEGDIDLNGKPIEAYTQEAATEDPNLMRNAVRSPYKRWPKGEIPALVSSMFSSYERSRIASAIKQFRKHTCIKFVPRRNQEDYVYIHKGDGCYSLVGRHGGRQPLSLGKDCMNKGIIMHELMHTAGFFHEQSRADRDKYIDIDYSNVIPEAYDQFQKYSLRTLDHLDTPYDYASIMHYGAYAFSRNRRRTVLPKKKGVSIGQRDGFSRNDVVKLNKLYNCPDQLSSKPTSYTTVVERPGILIIPQSGCKDTRGDCYRFTHKCGTPKGREYCPKTCGFCRKRREPVIECFNRFPPGTCESLKAAGHCHSGPLRSMSTRNCCRTCADFS